MKQHQRKKAGSFLHARKLAIVGLLLSVVVIMNSGFRHVPKSEGINADSLASVQAFSKVYSVLMSPRCMNCHPSGDVPLQGDDNHLHAMSPKRGIDGKGVSAMKCANCHQSSNAAGLHMPPGSPDWHLPSAAMKMIFQGRTPNQLAKQLMDPAQNGNKNRQQLIDHADDRLVLAGWNPGEGRSLPPISHAEFKMAWITWINKGAYAPATK
jgi:hypothetical protein